MANKGFLKLYRNITENSLYFSEPFTKMQAWLDLLMLANYQDTTAHIRGVKIVVKRGQVCRSITELAKRWDWSRNKVIRFMNNLVDICQVDVQNCSIINLYTIRDYDMYQGSRTIDGAIDETTDEATDGTTQNLSFTGDQNMLKGNDGTERRTNNRTLNGTLNGTRNKNIRNNKEENIIPSMPLLARKADCDNTNNSDKGRHKSQTLNEVHLAFNEFWDLYGKKVGRASSEKLFVKLTKEERARIFATIPAYKQSTPDIKFRKNPANYLKDRAWEDELMVKEQQEETLKIDLIL